MTSGSRSSTKRAATSSGPRWSKPSSTRPSTGSVSDGLDGFLHRKYLPKEKAPMPAVGGQQKFEHALARRNRGHTRVGGKSRGLAPGRCYFTRLTHQREGSTQSRTRAPARPEPY